MGVDSKHPLYSEHEEDWRQMRDSYRGERIIKDQGFKYLPPTSGMVADGIERVEQKGAKAYESYKARTRYPDIVREAVEALLGVMHRKPPAIELPAAMEPLMENATARNESLDLLLRRINEEQLVSGRLGLLADVLDSGEKAGQPYLAVYEALDPINWDEGRSDGIEQQNLNFVSIDETDFERVRDFEWEEKRKYRVLLLAQPGAEDLQPPAEEPETGRVQGDDGTEPVANIPQGEGVYMVGVFRDEQASFDPNQMVAPQIAGQTLDKLPFVFINTKDIVPEPDDPPLLGLSNLSLAIYRGEADYRQALFMQGQDTLVVIGGAQDDDEEHRVGAGATIELPQGGDAKFIGVDSSGLPEMRSSLENDYVRAAEKGGQLLDNSSGEKESGEALRVRVAAKTATLNQIALAGAAGLQHVLRIVAEWMGANPEDVKVTPNLDFADDQLSGQAVVEYMSARTMGAPLSLRSIHEIMVDRGLTERTFEEEVAEMVKEAALEIGPQGTDDEDGPEDDEDEQGGGPGREDEEEEEDEEDDEEQERGGEAD